MVPAGLSFGGDSGYQRCSDIGMGMPVIHGERRAHRRYRVDLSLRYALAPKGGGVETGTATAIEMSRAGVLLQSGETALPVGSAVEIVIPWPMRLQGACALELVITGSTVRANGPCTAVRIATYQFRTCGPQSFEMEEAREGRALGMAGGPPPPGKAT